MTPRVAINLKTAEARMHAARLDFYDAIKAAHQAGASYREIGRAVGISFGRVGQIVRGRKS